MKRYWFSDGLVEIGLGLGFWVMGGVLAGLGWLPGLVLKILAMPLAGVVISAAVPLSIGWVRARCLPSAEPLTLYHATWRSQLWGAAVILPALLALALLYNQLNEQATLNAPALWMTATGLFFGFIPLALGFTTGVFRFYGLAVPLTLLGSWLGTTTADLWAALLIIWFSTGGLFILSGTAALVWFRWERRREKREERREKRGND